MPNISIIVPVYNVEAYIEKCMQSICAQTYKDFEVILVDDCGEDNSVAIAEETLKQGEISYSLLHHEHNRGLSAARNTGMEKSCGKYVLFVDSDDLLAPKCLELLVTEAEKMNADMVYGSFETFGEKTQLSNEPGKPYVMAWNKLCRRSFLIENNISFIEGLIHEDCPWSFEVECKAKKISAVSEVTYRYLIRKTGLQLSGDYDRHFQAYCTILKDYARTIAECKQQTQNSSEDYTGWFETQKALCFTITLEKGTAKQLHEMYHLIRTLIPKSSFSKASAHYWMPEVIGCRWYKKFHKYYLC